jgi:hypothetical protein
MADISDNAYSWSTTESSNTPAGSTTIGTGLAPNLRAIQTGVAAYIAEYVPCNIENGYLDWSVSSNILTVAVKTLAGSDPSAADPVYIHFRNVTAGTGSPIKRKLTAATSIAINDTATLGTVNSIAFRIWAVAFDDGGTVRLGVINCVTSVAGAGAGRDVTAIYPLSGWGIASSTQEVDGADSAQVFYTDGAAVSSKAYSTLGYATWESGLATAGTWSGAPTREHLWLLTTPLPGQVIQVQRNDTGAVATGTTLTPSDDTIPQNTEGDQYMSQAITPTSTANVLDITAQGVYVSTVSNTALAQSIHQDSVANALKTASAMNIATGVPNHTLVTRLLMLSSTTSSTTFKVRTGAGNAGTVTFNGGAGSRFYGGVLNSFVEAREIMG